MRVLLIVAAGTLTLAGQPQTGSPASFAVASVKKSAIARDHPQGFRIPSTAIHGLTGDRLFEPYITLIELIMQAYEVKDYQISRLPDWGGNMGDQFDIEARVGVTSSVRDSQVRPMLQRLLAERFRLTLHRTTKELPVYEVLIGTGGPKFMQAAGPPNPHTPAMSIETLSTLIAMHLDRPVIDRTGLADGRYEIPLDLVALARCGQGGDAVSCVSGLVDQLGLRLTGRKALVEVLVIDRVQQPTPN